MNALPSATPPTHRLYEQRADPALALVSRMRVEIPEASETSFGFDAALEADAGVKFSSSLKPWTQVRDGWLAQIVGEDTLDVSAIYYRTGTPAAPRGWFLRETDGAFCRRTERDALAYTPRAWAQLVTLMLQEVPDKPRSPVDAYRWLGPSVRAEVFRHLRDRSHRRESENSPILLRTYLTPGGLRALRAVVSSRHSGRHFDDDALARALDAVLPVGAEAFVSRSIDRTIGHAVLESSETARAALSWSNSETGAASLGFGASCWIVALGTLIRSNAEEGIEADLTKPVTISSANGSSRRSHTLPRVGYTYAMRAALTRERMVASIEKASTEARALAADWAKALVSFPAGMELAMPTDRKMIAEILLDVIGERTRLKEDDREALKAIIVESDNLAQLPYLSAAHIAGAWALLGAKTDDAEESARCQLEAGRWVKERF